MYGAHWSVLASHDRFTSGDSLYMLLMMWRPLMARAQQVCGATYADVDHHGAAHAMYVASRRMMYRVIVRRYGAQRIRGLDDCYEGEFLIPSLVQAPSGNATQ
jgi:hypothetical protein